MKPSKLALKFCLKVSKKSKKTLKSGFLHTKVGLIQFHTYNYLNIVSQHSIRTHNFEFRAKQPAARFLRRCQVSPELSSLILVLNFFSCLFEMTGISDVFHPHTGLFYPSTSVTRSGDLWDFGQLLKAFGSTYFGQISHILGKFCKGVKIYHFSNEIIFG